MSPRTLLFLAVAAIAACSGREGRDADDGGGPPDARGPGDDAPRPQPDARPVDARPVDARTIDAPPGEVGAFVYVATFLGGLVPYTMDAASGRLAPLTTEPYLPHGHLYAIARSAGGDLVYTVDADARLLYGFHVGGDGLLTQVPGSPVATGTLPLTVAVDPKGRFVYVGDAGDAGNGVDPTLAVYAVDPATGEVTAVTGSPFAVAGSPAFVAAEASGTFVYMSQQGTAGIRAYRIDPDAGKPTEVTGSPFGGNDVFAGALVLHPTGPFLYSAGGHLGAFRIDPTSGALTAVHGSPYAAGVGTDPFAIALALDVSGTYAFAITDRVDGHVTAYRVDPVDGSMIAVSQGPVASGSAPYAVAVDPRRGFVYVGRDDGNITQLALDPATGALHAVDPPAAINGLQPELVMIAAP